MSAPPCRQCGGPCEAERHHYAKPTCFACLPPPAPMRVVPTRDQLEAELTRLRAALQAIADRQPHRPMSEEHPTNTGLARALARFHLAEMAREALVKP